MLKNSDITALPREVIIRDRKFHQVYFILLSVLLKHVCERDITYPSKTYLFKETTHLSILLKHKFKIKIS